MMYGYQFAENGPLVDVMKCGNIFVQKRQGKLPKKQANKRGGT